MKSLCPYKVAAEEVEYMEDHFSIGESALAELKYSETRLKEEINEVKKCALLYERHILKEIFNLNDSGYEYIRVAVENKNNPLSTITTIIAENTLVIIDYKYGCNSADNEENYRLMSYALDRIEKIETCKIKLQTFYPFADNYTCLTLGIEELNRKLKILHIDLSTPITDKEKEEYYQNYMLTKKDMLTKEIESIERYRKTLKGW